MGATNLERGCQNVVEKGRGREEPVNRFSAFRAEVSCFWGYLAWRGYCWLAPGARRPGEGMNRTALISCAFLAAWGCASTPKPTNEQKLYFSLEVRREGHLVAKPKLLGETGKVTRVERRQPGAALADYQLILVPRPSGAGYHLQLDLSLPDVHGQAELDLAHGQVRQLELGPRAGELQVSLMMMRVDSPEFRLLMDIGEQRTSENPRSI